MITRENILGVLHKRKQFFESELGVKSIGLFGSYARANYKAGSDVDILVDMPPNFSHMCLIWKILEEELQAKVDLVRLGTHLRKSFIADISKEIVYA